MSRKGDCRDNAVAESLFATLKTEQLDDMNLDDAAAVVRTVADCVDRFYNPVRLHSTLGNLSPTKHVAAAAGRPHGQPVHRTGGRSVARQPAQ